MPFGRIDFLLLIKRGFARDSKLYVKLNELLRWTFFALRFLSLPSSVHLSAPLTTFTHSPAPCSRLTVSAEEGESWRQGQRTFNPFVCPLGPPYFYSLHSLKIALLPCSLLDRGKNVPHYIKILTGTQHSLRYSSLLLSGNLQVRYLVCLTSLCSVLPLFLPLKYFFPITVASFFTSHPLSLSLPLSLDVSLSLSLFPSFSLTTSVCILVTKNKQESPS